MTALRQLVDEVRISGRHIEHREDIDTGGMFDHKAIVARDPDPATEHCYVGIGINGWGAAGARRASTFDAALEHARRLAWEV